MISRYLSLILLMGLSLGSCAKLGLFGKADKDKTTSAFGPTGIPPMLRAQGSADQGLPISPVPGGSATPLPPGPGITPESEIIYTDPDNPTGEVPELAAVLENKKAGPWEESETIARKRSIREGKPMLIFFTDSMSNPMCIALTQELFNRFDFSQWADEKLVRLRVDSNIKIEDENLSGDARDSRRINITNYIKNLRDRYKVMGFPTLILLNPSGEVIYRKIGYKRGDANYIWGVLKHNETVSMASYTAWRAALEKKGYREWQDRKGRKIFAKLLSYSKGTLVMVEPDGSRAQTNENKLCDGDRAWIAEQKKIRNIQ
jgi:thioredoxin-related protein